eukprot:gnl/Trimastix_PCT/594.p1 GENE.gnl/Trimastix_PCT/594~~gnl/Trimastix_PCT/594.p1  ORF type:complete len:541 (+),score=148.20 gnl/Trimastix_PCT/594:67-1623(+)
MEDTSAPNTPEVPTSPEETTPAPTPEMPTESPQTTPSETKRAVPQAKKEIKKVNLYLDTVQKRIRAVKKKLLHINGLAQKQKQGESLNADQMKTLAQQPRLASQLEDFESILKALEATAKQEAQASKKQLKIHSDELRKLMLLRYLPVYFADAAKKAQFIDTLAEDALLRSEESVAHLLQFSRLLFSAPVQTSLDECTRTAAKMSDKFFQASEEALPGHEGLVYASLFKCINEVFYSPATRVAITEPLTEMQLAPVEEASVTTTTTTEEVAPEPVAEAPQEEKVAEQQPEEPAAVVEATPAPAAEPEMTQEPAALVAEEPAVPATEAAPAEPKESRPPRRRGQRRRRPGAQWSSQAQAQEGAAPAAPAPAAAAAVEGASSQAPAQQHPHPRRPRGPRGPASARPRHWGSAPQLQPQAQPQPQAAEGTTPAPGPDAEGWTTQGPERQRRPPRRRGGPSRDFRPRGPAREGQAPGQAQPGQGQGPQGGSRSSRPRRSYPPRNQPGGTPAPAPTPVAVPAQ